MRLKTQFIISMFLFGIILVFLAASAIITNQQLEKVSQQDEIASSIAQAASELSYLANDYLIYRESQQLKRWQSRFASFSSEVASLNVYKPDQWALVRNIRANEQRLKQVFDSVASAPAGSSPSRRTALDMGFLQVSWSRMAVQSQGLVSDASRLSQLLHQQMDQLTEKRSVLLYVMVGLFGVFLLASYMLTYRRILKSLARLQAGTAVIGSGNLDFTIKEKKNDEIGDLSHAFNQMTTNLKAVTASKADLEREITERKKVEEELRRQREWLRVTLSSIGDAVIASDTEGQITFLNPVAVTLTGWQPEEALGQPIQSVFRIINEKTHTPAEDLVARVLNEKRVVALANDTALVTKDGHEVPIEDSAGPILDANGNVTGVVVVFHDVTQRRRAQEALRESANTLRIVADFTYDWEYWRSPDNCFLYLSPSCERVTGYTREEFLHDPGLHSRIIHPHDRERFRRHMEEDLHNSEACELEFRIVRNDGQERWIGHACQPVLDAHGKTLGRRASNRDITERKRAEEALREAHERAVWLARLPEENPSPVLRVSAEGPVLYCNPASAELPGWACKVDQPLPDVLLPFFRQALMDGQEVQHDVQIGEKFYFVSVTPFPAEGYANIYGRDITEHKQAEAALRESEARLNRSQEIAHLGSWELDLVNNRLNWSDEVYRIFGLQPQEFGATYEAFLEAVHPDDRTAVDAAYSGSVREGRDVYEIEHRVVRKSTGEIRIVHERCEHIRDASGRIILSLGMVHDITERKRAEEALKQRTLELQQLAETLEQRVQERTEELEEANKALRNLSTRLLSAQEEERKRVAGELHDTIGACLSGIKFKVESTLQQMGKTQNHMTESLKTIIPVIQEGVEECRRIQMDLRPSMLDDLGLLPTLSWFCRRFQTIYSGIRIEQEIDIKEADVPPPLKIVAFRVTQEAMNNSAKHSKANIVRLSLRKINGRMELVLEDNGRGFDLEKVIGSESKRRGLGLTSMRERTELSGGSFNIESGEGKGTTIRAWWPL